MTMQRKLLLLALLLLLFSVGMVVAQSSTNYRVTRSVISSGGVADSANYTVSSVIGQPATGIVDSLNYQVSAGFLVPASDYVVYLPLILK